MEDLSFTCKGEAVINGHELNHAFVYGRKVGIFVCWRVGYADAEGGRQDSMRGCQLP